MKKQYFLERRLVFKEVALADVTAQDNNPTLDSQVSDTLGNTQNNLSVLKGKTIPEIEASYLQQLQELQEATRNTGRNNSNAIRSLWIQRNLSVKSLGGQVLPHVDYKEKYKEGDTSNKKPLNIQGPSINSSGFSDVEYSKNIIEVTSGNHLRQLLSSDKLKEGTTLSLAKGIYKGSFECKQKGISFTAQDPQNPPEFSGSDTQYSLMLHGDDCSLKNIKCTGGNMAVRVAGNNINIDECSFKNNLKQSIHVTGNNVLIEDCDISRFHKDAIFIQGHGVTIDSVNIYDYLGTDDAHNDAIQIAAQVSPKDPEYKKRLFSGKEVIKGLKIVNTVIDMGLRNEGNKGRNLQGILASQVILEDAVITDNNIAVDSSHGITASFIGNSVLTDNTLRPVNGNMPRIKITPSRAANSSQWILGPQYNVYSANNTWDNGYDNDNTQYYFTPKGQNGELLHAISNNPQS